MQYSELVEVYQRLQATTKRLEKTQILAEFFQKLNDSDIAAAVLLLQGRAFPEWQDSKTGINENYILKAISKISGRTTKKLKQEWKSIGDLGEVTQKFITNKSQSTLFSQKLSIQDVLTDLQKLPEQEGAGSVDRKIGILTHLLNNTTSEEAKYIVRTLLQDLRIGVSSGTLRDGIVKAFLYTSQEISDRDKYNQYVALVDGAYNKLNDFAQVARLAKKGEQALKKVSFEFGKAAKVMLAQKENSIQAAFKRVGKPAALEYKLDGFRLQIHKQQDSIKLFTRRLEEVTKQFPDIVETVQKQITAKSCILDGEAVGYDKKTQNYKPFQHISQRIRRKHGIADMASKLPVELNIFDILSCDGNSTIEKPLVERIKILSKIVKPKKLAIRTVERIITDNEEVAQKFFDESIKAGNEGVMYKKLDAPYQPGSRVGTMVKLKNVQDTVDLVVVGAEWGTGKRSGWLTSLELATYDSVEQEFLTIGKVGTGLKELPQEGLSFGEITELLKDSITSEEGRQVKINPSLVIEIEYEEIQKSTTYDSGFALRFPRVKTLRDDRKPEDCTSLQQISELYKQQSKTA